MTKRFLTLTLALMLLLPRVSSQPATLQVKELRLSNGMAVWLNEDHSQPKVYGAVVVRAGGKDCPDTGIAHYFEHIMFKGTDRIGTVDYAAERPWLDSIAAQYDLLSQTTDNARRTAIQQHINELSLRAAEYAIPNEFSRLTAKYGGTGLNAGTSADMTYYYNTFLPQYLEHWCWLNSERLIRPVFRLFQGELENVYEEKNRGADGLNSAYDAALRAVFKDQPYAFPVIGSTENLKNPRLSDMEAFYKKYYVAPNMCLVLVGDFTPGESLERLLEQTFGRIATGPVPERQVSSVPPFASGERTEIKLPIPIVKAEALLWRAPTEYEPDADALMIANRLLSNDKAGLLDSLMNEHVLLAAGAAHVAKKDAAVTALFVVPNILFGSMKKAEQRCMEQLQRVMDGDFSEEQMEQQKRDLLMEMEKGIETIAERAEVMTDVFAQGHTWQEYLGRIERLKRVTKADVVAAARRYYGDVHMTLRKKYGNEKKETLSQPGYTPVQPRNAGARSEFAEFLESLPSGQQPIRTVDFNNDVLHRQITPHATLYYKENPVNDIFTLSLRYHDGKLHTPLLAQLATYVSQLGTDSLRKQQLESAWQRLGTTLEAQCGDGSFAFTITGRDSQLQPALGLLNHFLGHAKSDDKALRELKQEEKVERKAFGEQKDDALIPMIDYVRYGAQSPTLRQPSLKEIKALTNDDMMQLFRTLQQYDCDIIYCGTRKPDEVARMAQQTLPLAQCRLPKVDTHRTLQPVPDEPTVYFFHVPKSRQNFVCSYEQLPPQGGIAQATTARLWARYLGGGMHGVLFQNIREFQSLAYTTEGALIEPNYARHADAPLAFVTVTGTQADKTMQVMSAVDSLLRNMPMKTENLEAARQELISRVQNTYPSFRSIAYYVANQLQAGYTDDPDRPLADELPRITQQQVEQFARQHIAPGRRIWMIIGDRRLTDMQALAAYGKVVELKKEEIYR